MAFHVPYKIPFSCMPSILLPSRVPSSHWTLPSSWLVPIVLLCGFFCEFNRSYLQECGHLTSGYTTEELSLSQQPLIASRCSGNGRALLSLPLWQIVDGWVLCRLLLLPFRSASPCLAQKTMLHSTPTLPLALALSVSSDLLFMVCSACFLLEPRTSPVTAPLTVGWALPHQ